MAVTQEVWRSVHSSSDGLSFMIKSDFNLETCSYQLDVFDGSRFWRQIVSKEEFCKKCREFNPKVEADCFYLFNEIKCKFEELGTVEGSNVELTRDGTTCKIHFKIKLGGNIPFIWIFELCEEMSPTTLSKDMVLPMFVMLGELLHQRKELFDIIQRKDMEIQDYRDQGVTASRRSLETAQFDASTYQEERLNSKMASAHSTVFVKLSEQELLGFLEDPIPVFGNPSCQQLYRQVLFERRRILSSKSACSTSHSSHSNTIVEEDKQGVYPFDEVQTQRIVSTIPPSHEVSNSDIGDDLIRRENIAGRLAEKASEFKVKEKRKKVNL